MKRRDFLRAIGITSLSLPLISIKAFSVPKEETPFEVGLSDAGERPHGLYQRAKEAFFDGSLDWEQNKVRVALVNGDGYTPDLTRDKSLSDIPHSKIVAISKPLKDKTLEKLILDADDVWMGAVYGEPVDYLVLYRPALLSSGALLIMCIGNFPSIIPNGGDVKIEWDNSVNKICSL